MISISWSSSPIEGQLVERYKRFFVDARLHDGRVITAHTSNTGAMTGLLASGNPVILTHDAKPSRRLDYSLQAIHADGAWVGVNTLLPNALVERAIHAGAIAELGARCVVTREVPYPDGGRADLYVEDELGPPVFIEVKSVTLKGPGDTALFPDAPSERGRRHLHSLMVARRLGYRAMLVLVVQRGDCAAVAPAAAVDPAYAHAFVDAYEDGVSIVGLKTTVSTAGVFLEERIPIEFTPIGAIA
jgi:sugar fermentation stimulation protein A